MANDGAVGPLLAGVKAGRKVLQGLLAEGGRAGFRGADGTTEALSEGKSLALELVVAASLPGGLASIDVGNQSIVKSRELQISGRDRGRVEGDLGLDAEDLGAVLIGSLSSNVIGASGGEGRDLKRALGLKVAGANRAVQLEGTRADITWKASTS